MVQDIKRIDIKEFREQGFLQEVNRKFFHPLGLALEVIIDDDTGEEKLGGVWDYRDDPEGMFFGAGVINDEKIINVFDLYKAKVEDRIKSAYKHDILVGEDGIQVK